MLSQESLFFCQFLVTFLFPVSRSKNKIDCKSVDLILRFVCGLVATVNALVYSHYLCFFQQDSSTGVLKSGFALTIIDAFLGNETPLTASNLEFVGNCFCFRCN